MMMGENFISYFNKISKTKNNFYVETDNEINIKRLKKATDIDEIFPVKMGALFNEGITRYNYITILAGLDGVKVLSNLARDIDLVVVLGGDDYTEDYGWKGPVLNAIKFNILKKAGLKVVMMGQTMGPYKSFRKPIMKKLLSNIDRIYPRDAITLNYLKTLGLINIEITDDLALLPLSKQQELDKSKKFITYCPSELIYRYSKEGNREDWIDFNLFMIDKIMNKYPNKSLVLLAHVIKPEHVDDRLIANELYNLVKDKYSDRIIIKSEEMYPFEVRDYIQQSLFTISSRMHPVVSSIQCEIPAIALSYSTKYWGIIGDRYGLGDYIIDIRYLKYDEMKGKFEKIIEKIDQEYIEIQASMIEKNRMAKRRLVETMEDINKLVETNNKIK
ncbi:polysaccharide pyruvyl transferase family protein [Pradoshia sp. D12]|uniref:polysaccharide pyruvyl transferase family protein n=2 Tax=Bacillaceae TaxID=186817 RepID=UPI00178C666B|nr:polysaccharide pyruvyl transferase family protein [Pradoshia sp. D12]